MALGELLLWLGVEQRGDDGTGHAQQSAEEHFPWTSVPGGGTWRRRVGRGAGRSSVVPGGVSSETHMEGHSMGPGECVVHGRQLEGVGDGWMGRRESAGRPAGPWGSLCGRWQPPSRRLTITDV